MWSCAESDAAHAPLTNSSPSPPKHLCNDGLVMQSGSRSLAAWTETCRHTCGCRRRRSGRLHERQPEARRARAARVHWVGVRARTVRHAWGRGQRHAPRGCAACLCTRLSRLATWDLGSILQLKTARLGSGPILRAACRALRARAVRQLHAECMRYCVQTLRAHAGNRAAGSNKAARGHKRMLLTEDVTGRECRQLWLASLKCP